MAKKKLTDPNTENPSHKGAGQVRKPPKSVPSPEHDPGDDWRNPMIGKKRNK